MAKKITEDCIDCGACEPECPNGAVSCGDAGHYAIDPDKCTECVGADAEPRCIEVCPVEACIVPDPAHSEAREVLQARYERLHA